MAVLNDDPLADAFLRQLLLEVEFSGFAGVVFYKGHGPGTNLYVVGSLASGKEKLARMKENFKARIEALEEGKANNSGAFAWFALTSSP